MSFLKPLVMTKKRFKFQVTLYIDELNSVPTINGFLYCKASLKNGGTYTQNTSRLNVSDHCVSWRSKFEFSCKMSASPNTGILDPCIVRLSVRREVKGGRSAMKVGYVDLNLAEFAGSGQTSRHCLLEGYDDKIRLDNSILKIVVGMQLLSGDVLFKTPAVRDVAFQLPEETNGIEPQNLDGESSGFGSLPRKAQKHRTQIDSFAPSHSRNLSSVSQQSKRSDYSSQHSRTPSNISQTNSVDSTGEQESGISGSGSIKSPHKVPSTPGRNPPPRPPPPHSATICANRIDDTRVNANDVVSKLIASQDFTHNTSGGENDNLQLFVTSDGSTALSGQTLHNRVGSGVYHPVVFDARPRTSSNIVNSHS